MNNNLRIAAYLAQTGRKSLTPRQRRRAWHKERHLLVWENTVAMKAGIGDGAR